MDPGDEERDWQALLSGPVQNIGRLLSTPSVPASCRLSSVCCAWRDAASTTSGQRIIYRGRVAGDSSDGRDACFAQWLEKNARTVSSLELVWLDSPNAPVTALCKAAAAAASAGEPLPLQRLVWTGSRGLYSEVAALLPHLPHLRHLDMSSCLPTPYAAGSDLIETPEYNPEPHYTAALQALRSSRLRHLSMSLSNYSLLAAPALKPQAPESLSHWLAANCSHLPTSLQSLHLQLDGLPVAFDASWLQHLVNLRHLAVTGQLSPPLRTQHAPGLQLDDLLALLQLNGLPVAFDASWLRHMAVSSQSSSAQKNQHAPGPQLNALLALPRLATVHMACKDMRDCSASLSPVSHLVKELVVTHASVLPGLGSYKAVSGLEVDLATTARPMPSPPAPVRVQHLTISMQSLAHFTPGAPQQQQQQPGTTTSRISSSMLGEVIQVGQLRSLCLYDLLPEAGPTRSGVLGQVGPVNAVPPDLAAATQLTALQLLLSNKAVEDQAYTWGPAVARLSALEDLDTPLALLDAPYMRGLPFQGLRRLVLRVVPQELTSDTLRQLVGHLAVLGRLQRVRVEVMQDAWAPGVSPAAAAHQGVVHSCWAAAQVLEAGLPQVAVEVCRVVEEEGVYSSPNQALVRAGV